MARLEKGLSPLYKMPSFIPAFINSFMIIASLGEYLPGADFKPSVLSRTISCLIPVARVAVPAICFSLNKDANFVFKKVIQFSIYDFCELET